VGRCPLKLPRVILAIPYHGKVFEKLEKAAGNLRLFVDI
jgi:hypothetical protein